MKTTPIHQMFTLENIEKTDFCRPSYSNEVSQNVSWNVDQKNIFGNFPVYKLAGGSIIL